MVLLLSPCCGRSTFQRDFAPLLLFSDRTKRLLGRDITAAIVVLTVSVAVWKALSVYLSSISMSVSFLLLSDKIKYYIVNNTTGGRFIRTYRMDSAFSRM